MKTITVINCQFIKETAIQKRLTVDRNRQILFEQSCTLLKRGEEKRLGMAHSKKLFKQIYQMDTKLFLTVFKILTITS